MVASSYRGFFLRDFDYYHAGWIELNRVVAELSSRAGRHDARHGIRVMMEMPFQAVTYEILEEMMASSYCTRRLFLRSGRDGSFCVAWVTHGADGVCSMDTNED